MLRIVFHLSCDCFSHYLRQILEALKYCHSKKVVHGNVRPQCLLLANKENSASVKLGGFSNAVDLNEDESVPEGKIILVSLFGYIPVYPVNCTVGVEWKHISC